MRVIVKLKVILWTGWETRRENNHISQIFFEKEVWVEDLCGMLSTSL